MIYTSKITVFNYNQKDKTYFKTLIDEVSFQPYYKYEPNVTSTADLSEVLCIFILNSDYKGFYVNNKNPKYYISPKHFEFTNNTFTLRPKTDFIIKGDYTDIPETSLNEIKNKYDDVFMINKVIMFDEVFPHIELVVK